MRKLILSLFITIVCASAVQAQSTFYTVQQLEEAMNGDRIIAFWTYLHKQGSSNLALKGIRLDSLMIAMDSMIGSGGGGSGPDYYQTIRLNGVNANQRQALNFVNNPGVFQFNVTDDSGSGETEVTGTVTGLDLTSSSTAIIVTNGAGTTLKNTQLDLDPSQIILSTLGGELDLTQISDGGAATGDVLQWNGTAWVPADVSGGGGSYVAGAGIDITGVIISNTGDLLVTNEGDLSVIEDSPTQVSLISNTSGSTNVLIVQGDGIDVTADEITNTLTITNTGDTDASDDLTDATIFDGDVTGTYNNLQIEPGVVGTPELADGAVTMVKINQAGATSGQVIKWNGSAWAPAADATGGSGGFYETLQEEGVDLTQRDKLNFVGSAAAATDDGANNRTNVTFDTDLNALADIATTGVYVITASGTSTTRTITAGTGISVTNGSGVGGNPTITNIGDLSATNELQIFTNSSDATNHYIVLSDGGGSIQFAEGTGIGFATTGTSLDGVLTITNTTPDQVVSLTEGAGIDITGTYPNFTIAATGGASGYSEIQEEGTGLTPYTDLNFIGSALTASDDVPNLRTNVTVDSDVNALADIATTGIYVITGAGLSTTRSVVAGTGSITIGNGSGVAGNITINNTDPDQDASNEAWTIDGDDTDTELISNQTLKFQGAGINSTDYNPATNTLSITGTEVDGSTTNEIQDLSITGAASPFTIDISGSTNDLQVAAGTGISLSESPANTLVITNTVTDTRSNAEENNVNVVSNATAFDFGSGFDLTADGTEADVALDLSEVTEQVQDNAWNVLGGTQTGITVTYNDGANNVSFVATDASATNEAWTIDADDVDTELISNQTVKFQGGGIIATDYDPVNNFLIITGTEVDGSTINELQTFSNAGTATTHTVTLSNSGGSIQFIEGDNVSFTTGGTALNGTLELDVVLDGNGYYGGNGGNGGDGTIPSLTTSTITNQFTLSRATDDVGGLVPFRISVAAGNEPDFMSFVNGSDSLLISKGDQEFEIFSNKTLVVSSNEIISFIADSVQVQAVPTAVENERTLLFVSPQNTIVKYEGLDPDIINQNGAGTGDVLKWNGSKWAPGTDDTGGGGGGFYQTMRDNGTAETQRGKLNFLNGTHVSFNLTDDAGNDETEVNGTLNAASITTTEMADNSVNTSELVNLAVTNAKINDVSVAKLTSGTVVGGLTFTATNGTSINFNYNSGSPAFQLDDSGSAAGMYSEDGTQYVYADNVSVLIGSGTTNMNYIDGVLRLNDSDLTNWIGIKPPATGSLTANYTLTLPVDDGTADQLLKTDGAGNLSWTTVTPGGSGDVNQNGNSFGANMVIGTNDNFTVNLEQNGTTFFTGGTDKNISLINSVAATAATTDRLKINVNSTGTAANNFGGAILFNAESSTTNDQELARIAAYWTNATHSSREGAVGIQLGDNGGALAEIAKFDRGTASGRLQIGNATPLELTNAGISANTNFLLISGAGTQTYSRSPATTNSPVSFIYQVASTGTAANGFGSRFECEAETSTNAVNDIGYLDFAWSDVTNATRTSDFIVQTVNSATIAEAFRVYGNKRAMVGGGTNQASAAFQVTSTTGGLLPPKMTTAQRDAIASPTEGLSVYDTDLKGDYKYNGTAWKRSSMDAITGRSTGQIAAVASVATLTVGAADATYSISGNILVTTSGSEAFSLQCDYTDEDNTARTITIPILRFNNGSFITQTAAALGAVPYPSASLEIRCKASTAITIKTSGTFTGCTYNVQGTILRVE